MQFPRKLVLVGVLLSLIPIGLGIAAIVTPQWIHVRTVFGNPYNVSNATYSLWICDDQGCTCPPDMRFDAAKGLTIAGVVAIAVGALLTLLFDVFIKNRWIQTIPLILLYLGPLAILVGIVLYIWRIIDCGADRGQRLNKLGYSLILMLVSSLVGFLTAVYFAFATGFGIRRRRHQDKQTLLRSPVLVEQITERF